MESEKNSENIFELDKSVNALEKRIEALERNSHPPMPKANAERLEALEQPDPPFSRPYSAGAGRCLGYK